MGEYTKSRENEGAFTAGYIPILTVLWQSSRQIIDVNSFLIATALFTTACLDSYKVIE